MQELNYICMHLPWYFVVTNYGNLEPVWKHSVAGQVMRAIGQCLYWSLSTGSSVSVQKFNEYILWLTMYCCVYKGYLHQ